MEILCIWFVVGCVLGGCDCEELMIMVTKSDDAVNFTLRGVPFQVWLRLRHMALNEHKSMQVFLKELLEQAAAKGE
jgi:hypothetical protein